MHKLLQDLRYAVRTLAKKPGFTLIAVMTLALGIGASTAIFTVVDAALLRGLPYKSPERLYHLWESTPQKEFAQREFSYPDYQDYQQNQVCEGLAAYTGGGAIMSGLGEPERVLAPAASANFFSVLGVEPVIGRTFQPGEDKPGAPRVTVLTYGMWQRRFGGDKGILGQSLTLNGDSYIVVGVLPASFQFALRAADLWRPYQPTDAQLTRRFMHGTNLIGRLKPGVSLGQAQKDLSIIANRIEQENKQSHAGTGQTDTARLAGRSRICPADRLRQRGQSASHPLSLPAKGSCHSRCAWRQPLARDQATADRIDPAVVSWWRGRLADCLLGRRGAGRAAAGQPAQRPTVP